MKSTASSGRVHERVTTLPVPAINADLSWIATFGLAMGIGIAPYLRGLFFEPDLLPSLWFISGIFLLYSLDSLSRRSPGDFWLGPPISPGGRGFVIDLLAALIPLCYWCSVLVAVDKRAAIVEALEYSSLWMIYRCALWAGRLGHTVWVLRAIISGGLVVALVGLGAACRLLEFPGAYDAGQILSTFQYSNALGAYMMLCSLLAIAMSSTQHPRFAGKVERWLLVLANYLFLVTLIGSRSRGAWLVYPLALVVLFVVVPRKVLGKLLYNTTISLSCALGVSRLFLRYVELKAGATAWKVLLLGGAAVLLLALAESAEAWLIEQLELSHGTRRMLSNLAKAYVAVLILVAIGYSASIPASLGPLPEVMSYELETLHAGSPSVISRSLLNRDAIRLISQRPFLGGGGGAWNALYHMYQSYLYWTTEVHNHFLQVWVEAGLLAFIGYLGLWAYLLVALINCFAAARNYDMQVFENRWETKASQLLEANAAHVSLLAGVTVSLLALGVHSAMDFDLSIPAVALTTWCLLGLIRGEGELFAAANPQAILSKPWQSRITGWGVLAHLAATAVSALLVTHISYNLFAAGSIGAAGARVLLKHDFDGAERAFAQAILLDPWKASYKMDLGQVYTAKGVLLSKPELIRHGTEMVDQALAAQPYDLRALMKAVEVYTAQGELRKARETAWRLVELVPLSAKSYETYARCAITEFMYFVKNWSATDDKHSGGYREVLETVPRLPEAMEKLASEKGKYVVLRGYSLRSLAPTPTLEMLVGQAQLLLGRSEAAFESLSRARRDPACKKEAEAWMAAEYLASGRLKEAAALGFDLKSGNPVPPELEALIEVLRAVKNGE